MGYFDERELLQKQREKTEQPAFMAFMDAVCKEFGDGWVRKRDIDYPDLWKVDWTFRANITNGEYTICFDFEKGASFVEKSGKVNVGAYINNMPHGYSDNSLRPASVNISLKKPIAKIVSEIRTRYLEQFEVFRLDAVGKYNQYDEMRKQSHKTATELFGINPKALYDVEELREGLNEYTTSTRYDRKNYETTPDFRVKVSYNRIMIDITKIDADTAKKVVALLLGK